MFYWKFRKLTWGLHFVGGTEMEIRGTETGRRLRMGCERPCSDGGELTKRGDTGKDTEVRTGSQAG